MLVNVLMHGLSMPNTALLADRLALGVFFTSSGYHKLFSPVRRKALEQTFREDGCYSQFNMWAIPLGELCGGLGLVVGALSVPAAIGIIALCLGACYYDAMKRIGGFAPLDRADFVCDLLYLPEVLYIAMALMVVLMGPGNASIDAVVATWVR